MYTSKNQDLEAVLGKDLQLIFLYAHVKFRKEPSGMHVNTFLL